MTFDYSLSNKRVLVTGADGFIGSHLVQLLVEAGAQVRAMVYYNSWQSLGWLSDIPKSVRDSIEIFPGDIRDPFRVRQAVQGCAHVFHLSSLIAIPYSYVAAQAYVETNVSGCLNILEAAKDSESLDTLLHVSTSETYGSAQTVPISETHPLVGQSPYSASKIAADKMAESYYLSFELPVITARPFNTFGPRQTARAVIPTIASQLISKVESLKLGALSPTRDFNYVSDTARGMLELSTSKNAIGHTVNIGTGEEWSIETTAKMLMDVTGHHVEIETEEERMRPEQSEVNRLVADNSKIKSLVDWAPNVEFEEGLRLTANWIEKNLQYFEVNDYTI